ncbi:MAG: metal-dependent phosphohydrolase [Treponema sp.]|jgi:hypothetical protein|nr:metal-dependent phosphohydrolase [Treponema sp.]
MADNQTNERLSPVSLREVLANHKGYVKVLREEAMPVLCVNRKGQKKRTLSFKALYENNQTFWLQSGPWEYFLASGDLAVLKEKAEASRISWGESPGNPAEKAAAPAEEAPAEEAAAPAGKAPAVCPKKADPGFGEEHGVITAMTEPERVQLVWDHKKRLDSLITQRPKDVEAITQALVDTTRDAALINQVTLMGTIHMMDEDAKKRTQNLVDSTRAMVQSSSQLIAEDIFNDELMSTLVAKSNGTIIQHMTRAYLNSVAFLSYYNKLVSTSSIINKLRISFEKKYYPFYQPLLPHLSPEALTLERVFQRGMRAIPETDYFNWATGFLIHDIGKAAAVDYHEGGAAYNRNIVMEHVKLGCHSVMNKTNYPREAALITGYHHEYYGDPEGYGYFRSCLEQHKKTKPWVKQDYCVSYEVGPMLDYQALAYFPAKLLEIIDVYDSVTDPNRKYRDPLSPEKALIMMREEFIDKRRKIDPVLFDIFTDFMVRR